VFIHTGEHVGSSSDATENRGGKAMFISLWRRLQRSDRTSSRGRELRKNRRPSFRPKLESLEDRTLPAPLVFGILPERTEGTTSSAFAPHPPRPVVIAASGTLSGLHPSGSHPNSPAANHKKVTVVVNAPESVIDLGPIFARMNGVHPEDGLQVSLLGNTNPGLVKANLSEGELTLTYTPSKCGTAIITVAATDADGMSVRENILVMVLPSHPANPGRSSPLPAGQQMPITHSPPRIT
jgi:hypothetical protein